MQNEEKVLMAVDLSLSNTGVAIFDLNENIVNISSISTDSKEEHPKRIRKIVDEILDLANKFKPMVIVLEKGFFRFAASSAALNRVQGAIMYVLHNYDMVFYSPSTIKKAVSGKGNSSKEIVKESVLKKYPDLTLNNLDESDACAIGMTYFIKGRDKEDG